MKPSRKLEFPFLFPGKVPPCRAPETYIGVIIDFGSFWPIFHPLSSLLLFNPFQERPNFSPVTSTKFEFSERCYLLEKINLNYLHIFENLMLVLKSREKLCFQQIFEICSVELFQWSLA